jgi:TonB family protein
MIRKVSITCAVVLVVLGVPSVQAQQTYPAFTMVMQVTDYDAKGDALSSRTWTSYHTASGDWRSVGNSGGYEVATIYRRGRGVYTSNARTGVLLKDSDRAPGCPIRTAEQLRRDPRFARVETVLGFEAYVMSERLPVGYLMETFFVPDLGGGTPFKRVYTFDSGRRIVEEPISIILGEPSPADISGPDYRLVEQIPIFNNELASRIISKPDPVYPSEAQSRSIAGTIYVSVIVDESGRVLSAGSNTPIPFLTEAAVEAAYQTSFSPKVCNGQPVLARGIISYQFVLRLIPHARDSSGGKGGEATLGSGLEMDFGTIISQLSKLTLCSQTLCTLKS